MPAWVVDAFGEYRCMDCAQTPDYHCPLCADCWPQDCGCDETAYYEAG